MANFRRIGLLTRLHLDQVTDTLNHLVRFLAAGGGIQRGTFAGTR